jgi:hypothetical protein
LYRAGPDAELLGDLVKARPVRHSQCGTDATFQLGIDEANATSSATAVGPGQASSQAVVSGASAGQAQATAQTNFGNFSSVQATSTSPVGGATTPATAIAQAGGIVSLSNAIVAGQSFSVVSGDLLPLSALDFG